jgi:hypothetical protein
MDFRAVLLGIGATAFGYYLWRNGSRTSSLIRGTATSKIASAAKGYAEVQGRASAPPAGPLRDPITHDLCVWFSVVTEKFSFFDKCRWKTVKTARSSLPFVIDDGSARCLISPAEVTIDERGEDTIVNERWNLRHKVSWIREGDPVFAIGYLLRTSDLTVRTILSDPLPRNLAPGFSGAGQDERALTKRATDILRAWKLIPGQLAKFDANGDGKIDVQEWETVRTAARQAADGDMDWGRMSGAAPRSPDGPAVASDFTHRLIKPPDGRPFLLSTHGEASLVSSSRAQSFLGLVFFLIGVFTLLFLLRGCFGHR